MVVYPTIYKVFHIPCGCLGFQPSTAGGYVGVSVRSKGRNIPLMPRPFRRFQGIMVVTKPIKMPKDSWHWGWYPEIPMKTCRLDLPSKKSQWPTKVELS